MANTHKVLALGKASPIGIEHVQSVQIEITEDVPDFKTLKAGGEYYEKQAKWLAYALSTSLPQGTFHRLIVHLLEAQASYYRGPTTVEKSNA